jgi:hypothetical protein
LIFPFWSAVPAAVFVPPAAAMASLKPPCAGFGGFGELCGGGDDGEVRGGDAG